MVGWHFISQLMRDSAHAPVAAKPAHCNRQRISLSTLFSFATDSSLLLQLYPPWSYRLHREATLASNAKPHYLACQECSWSCPYSSSTCAPACRTAPLASWTARVDQSAHRRDRGLKRSVRRAARQPCDPQRGEHLRDGVPRDHLGREPRQVRGLHHRRLPQQHGAHHGGGAGGAGPQAAGPEPHHHPPLRDWWAPARPAPAARGSRRALDASGPAPGPLQRRCWKCLRQPPEP